MDKYKRIETIRNKWCARFDEEPDSWITVNGNHIPLDENGDPMGGQQKALGRVEWGDGDKPSKEWIKRYRELHKKKNEYEKDHPFDPYDVIMGNTPDFVNEFHEMEAERNRRESERSSAEETATQKEVKNWEKDHEPNNNGDTRKELEKYAEKQNDLFLSKSLMDEFSEDEIRGCIDKIGEVQKEFGINGKLIYTLSAPSLQREKDLFRGVGGVASYGNGVVTLNPTARWHESQKSRPYESVYHEVAHAIDERLSVAMGNKWKKSATADEIIETAFQNYSKNSSVDRGKTMTNVSPYAGRTNDNGKHDNREILAECVRKHMNGEADDFSKAVVETLKAYIKRYLS